MNARGLTILLAFAVGAVARAGDFTPDWLPPPPPPKGFFPEVVDSMPLASPGQEFSDLLLRLSGESTTNRVDLDRLKLAQSSDINIGKLSSNLDLPDPRDPRALPYRDWTAGQSVNLPLPVSEKLFMFGNVDSSGNSLDRQMVGMKGRTGLGWKWTAFGSSELQLRTGTLVSYGDSSSTVATGPMRSQLSLALQAKMALFGPFQLQYSGEALPAMTQADRKTLLTDLKVAMPLGTNQEVYLGAKYKWDDSLTPTPWVDRTQIYLGLKFQR